jgi:hypothetical protein
MTEPAPEQPALDDIADADLNVGDELPDDELDHDVDVDMLTTGDT